tara:strand:+ start:266 stop:709 length:444 start_codon:yes stop_codon:yes gene_type:complete
MFKKFIFLVILIVAGVLVYNFKKIRYIPALVECNMGESEVCLKKGKYYLSKSDSYNDLVIGAILLDKGCGYESPESCARLGKFLMKKEGTINEAKVYLSKACKLRSKAGCFGLGMIYEEVLKEKEKAQNAYDKSCSFGFKPACDIKL